ncbi:hypothetical protein MKX50_24645 [Paenibacillus sp. FSL W8-0186]|uniref:Uncharacterized protein n=1 Tax=Paenibacillus woosongensis TaxID=307580 RepID=A0ABQ4MSN0_9BACL|nr:hypothetical protein [Paenibacillus woosongensis]GIP58997.1 hypothetical protein J15TS10_28110 [Paenibacillus woosongensis]
MAQSKEVLGRAKRLQGRPVCITLHSGKTYVGYITDVNSSGLTLASAGAQPSTSSRKQGSRPKQRRAGSHASGSRSGSRRGGARKPSVRSRSRKPEARISAFLPILGSLFGGLGGTGATAGALGGALGSGMKLFGMIQRFVPVVKLGYGMIKSIRPFLGAVQGLMKPSEAAAAEGESP